VSVKGYLRASAKAPESGPSVRARVAVEYLPGPRTNLNDRFVVRKRIVVATDCHLDHVLTHNFESKRNIIINLGGPDDVRIRSTCGKSDP
jgi:hypothetical protein